MAEIFVYMTSADGDVIREWINAEDEIAWIVKAAQVGREYHWKAVHSLDRLEQGEYKLWHTSSGVLNIPSGSRNVPDAIIADPFAGWVQTLGSEARLVPWFGGNLPGPFTFYFSPSGRRGSDSIGRSGFNWLGNRYAAIGKPAPVASRKWWARLGRYVRSHATEVPWPYPAGIGRHKAYVFPDALIRVSNRVGLDANP